MMEHPNEYLEVRRFDSRLEKLDFFFRVYVRPLLNAYPSTNLGCVRLMIDRLMLFRNKNKRNSHHIFFGGKFREVYP